MNEPPRSPRQRKRDVLNRLEQDIDAWVSTAEPAGGAPYLIPLSFLWSESTLLLATSLTSPTGRNLRATGKAQIGIGDTRDVVLIQGTLQEVIATVDIPAELGDTYAAKTGWDPRQSPGYAYFRIQPDRLQAWREVDEIAGRDLIQAGRWLVE